ncbi:hypothetical protein ABN028_24280 [Actinopolymorpha sp. B17G11]|uniref:hypothetical protein n=1 Tax=Actinopolymorpha sp. B17G11 TaxID=3160861 RepID=UPI0032E45102
MTVLPETLATQTSSGGFDESTLAPAAWALPSIAGPAKSAAPVVRRNPLQSLKAVTFLTGCGVPIVIAS